MATTASNYSALADLSHTLQFTTTCNAFSVCCIFTDCRLVTASNAADPSASVFTSLLAGECRKVKVMLRPTVSQPASLSWCQARIWGLGLDFYYCQTIAGLLMWSAVSDERKHLSFTIAVGPRQHSNSWVRVSRDSWPYFTVTDSRLPQPGGPGSRIYIPQDHDGSFMPPSTGFPFRRLLRLAGLRWRCSNSPPHGVAVLWLVDVSQVKFCLQHLGTARIENIAPKCCSSNVAMGTYLLSRYSVTAASFIF
jgi:hypothetical protein